MFSFLTEATAQKANFAGTWALNATKSAPVPEGQGGRGGGMRASQLVVKQDANSLTVDRTRTGQDGPVTSTDKYTLDGKESVNTTPRGSSKSIAKWGADSKSVNFAHTRTFGEREMKSTEVWTLTDAKTLTIVTKSPGRDGGAERVMTLVYDKK